MIPDGDIAPEDRLREAGAKFSTPDPPITKAPDFSDDAVALTFSNKHAASLLFVPEWRHWLRWIGVRWERDTTLAVYDLVRRVCREQAALAEAGSAGSDNMVARIASTQKVVAVERLARSDRRHARAASLFDADPWVLNTQGGLVDLRTGMLRPHGPSDLVTKATAAAPGGDCPR